MLRPEGQASDLVTALAAEGASALSIPAIRILPAADWAALEAVLHQDHDWLVLTSVNGVAALGERAEAAAAHAQVAAIGPATARALRAQGIGVAFVPSAFTTVALARELPGPPGRVCLVRADIAGGELESILAERGFWVDRVDAYRSEPGDLPAISRALAGGDGQPLDGVALTSASITAAFARAAAESARPLPPLFSIGPATSAACRQAGLPVAAEARPHTIPALVSAMAHHLGPGPGTQGTMA